MDDRIRADLYLNIILQDDNEMDDFAEKLIANNLYQSSDEVIIIDDEPINVVDDKTPEIIVDDKSPEIVIDDRSHETDMADIRPPEIAVVNSNPYSVTNTPGSSENE